VEHLKGYKKEKVAQNGATFLTINVFIEWLKPFP
jgi:hypothetical protein